MLKPSFLRIILLYCIVFLYNCSSKNDIKRQVYFDFSLGLSKTEIDSQWSNFRDKNNGYFFTKHHTNDDFTYYSSIDARVNKYDTVINFISVFYFLEPGQYSEMVGMNQNNSTLYLDGESKNQVESISNDILSDLKTKYGNPTDSFNTSDLDFDKIKIKEFNWLDKNDVNVKFIKKTMYVMSESTPKYAFSFRIIYEYTDKIKNKHFQKKSPY